MKHLLQLSTFAALLLGGACPVLQAGISCATADYRGSYAFYTSGSLLQLPPAGAPLLGAFAQAGTFTADGQGNLVIESNASYNGLIQPANVPASYTITPDCRLTYTLTLPFPLSAPSTFTGVLSNANRATTVMITDPPGTIVVGEHVKQDTMFCGVADFRGGYAIDMGGAVAAPKNLAGPFHRVGQIQADGQGSFTATTIANYNGQPVPENFSGTYDVNGRCVLTLNYTDASGNAITINGPLGGRADYGMMLVLTTGWAVSGTIRGQQ